MDEMQSYYALGQEQNRLLGAGDVERLRTEVILNRYLPAPPAVTFDVGGGAGVYAFPLAEKGYEVHLIDFSPLHVEQAQAHSAKSGIRLATISQGDARNLAVASGSAQAVLLLGPLYHLVDRTDRLRALGEAHRILRPGGILVAAAISRFASLMDGLSRGMFQDPLFREIVAADLISGVHRNPTRQPEYFTTAYFHRPEELRTELSEAGFDQLRVLAVEGPAWGSAHFRSAAADAVQREALLAMLAQVEEEPSILGASAHFLGIATKP